MSDVELKDLQTAGLELNDLLDPTPPIRADDEDLENKVAEAGLLLESGDTISETTKNVLVTLGVFIPSSVNVISEKSSKVTRSACIAEAIRIGGTKKEMTFIANDLYVKNGGADCLNTIRGLLSFVLNILIEFGIVTEDNKTFKAQL